MSDRVGPAEVRIEKWTDADLDLLRLANSPEMTEHLGGPESEEKLVTRQRRYVDVAGAGTGQMYRVVLPPDLEVVGTVGYWEKDWQGQTVYEAGWGVLAGFQGRGIAVAATTAVVGRARSAAKHRFLHAFPSVDHPASNAVCRKVGFTFVGECDFEYPPGRPMRCNDWRLDLTGP